MHSVQFLNHIIENNHLWAYLVILLGLIFEGEIVLLATGVFSRLGALDFTTSLIFIFAGSFVKTIACYYIGFYISKKYSDSTFLKYVNKKILCIMPNFKTKPFFSIFISKFIMGLNYFTLIFSGFNRISLKTYFKAEIISTIIWAPSLLLIGYFFGETALGFSKEMWRFSFISILLILAFVFFDKLVANMFTMMKFVKNGFKNDHSCIDHCEK
ncbi:MAG: VTT domain-containing protein [Candidatus Pacebacteria bacterium]|nr:VTT domain-containing protein [Candidatus Paceibacterota bacterium]MCF7863143.1 VTT domain-containing protein [Candidatus Paceibacterota bacterium]